MACHGIKTRYLCDNIPEQLWIQKPFVGRATHKRRPKATSQEPADHRISLLEATRCAVIGYLSQWCIDALNSRHHPIACGREKKADVVHIEAKPTPWPATTFKTTELPRFARGVHPRSCRNQQTHTQQGGRTPLRISVGTHDLLRMS
jgi:hypothetical protein